MLVNTFLSRFLHTLSLIACFCFFVCILRVLQYYDHQILIFLNIQEAKILISDILHTIYLITSPIAFLIILSLVYKFYKKYYLSALASLVLSSIIVILLKSYFSVPRPYVQIKNIIILGSHATSYSFPSGHASISMLLCYFFMSYRWQQSILSFIICIFLAMCLGATRVVGGIHFMSDVWAGIWIGGFSFYVSFLIINYLKDNYQKYMLIKWLFSNKIQYYGSLVIGLFACIVMYALPPVIFFNQSLYIIYLGILGFISAYFLIQLLTSIYYEINS